MAKDPFWKDCVVSSLGGCEGKIDFHHMWIYAGRQINEKWAILPACRHHHDLVNRDIMVRDMFKWVSLRLATPEDLKKYPKTDWNLIKQYLKVK